MPKQRTRKVYFNKDVQNAIIEFNNLPDTSFYKKEKLFNELIYPAFLKLAENLINMNSWKFNGYETTFDDLQSDVVSFLYSKLSGYDPKKGKAYSYFTIICKNYLTQQSKELAEKFNRNAELDLLDVERDISTEISIKDYKESISDFTQEWCYWIDENIHMYFKSDRDLRIADSVIHIIKNAEDLDIYNKKMIYVLIRERADVKTQKITKVIKRLRKVYFEMFNEYLSDKNLIDMHTY